MPLHCRNETIAWGKGLQHSMTQRHGEHRLCTGGREGCRGSGERVDCPRHQQLFVIFDQS